MMKPHLSRNLLLYNLLAMASILFAKQSVQSAIPDPGFWDTTQEELDELLWESSSGIGADSKEAEFCNRLPGYTSEEVYQLMNVTVITMDHELLCADFPSTCSMNRPEKEHWLLRQTAWFSKPHVDWYRKWPHKPGQQHNKNKIPYNASRIRMARRACQAGRALLLPVVDEQEESGPGWIDVKGIGARFPVHHSRPRDIEYSNGLNELHNALWEYMNEKTVDYVFKNHKQQYPNHTDEHFDTVGCYAVLALGFGVPLETEPDTWVTFPAGAVVRQATRRHPNPYGFMAPQEGTVAEQILNAYGLSTDTAADDYLFEHLPNLECRRVNAQGTMRPRQLIDFGGIYGMPYWPIPKDTCLVHWSLTSKRLETPLWWDEERDMGSQEVRQFLGEEVHEFVPDPKKDDWVDTPYFQFFTTVREKRTWIALQGWRRGDVTLQELQGAINVGLPSSRVGGERTSTKVDEKTSDRLVGDEL